VAKTPDRLTSRLDPGALVKFTAVVALFAILADAALGHALAWENDPYWTYWITKTFLIATVFGLGTAWLGIGLERGAVITAVHTLVLTVYYWTLSPIGLPSHPSWLDLEHTWLTGVPIHFGVIYLGYVVALWLWRRRQRIVVLTEPVGSVAIDARDALAVGIGIVVVAGIAESLVITEFVGVTWFVVRLLIAVPFILAWWATAGRDRAAAVGGGLTLALIFATYGHFLGPVGLPSTNLRLIGQDPPPAIVHWLTYRQEFLAVLPVTIAIAVIGLLIVSAWRAKGWPPIGVSRTALGISVMAVLVLLGLGAVAAANTGPSDDQATLTSAGTARIEKGQYYDNDFSQTTGDLHLVAANRNPRVTPLPPRDEVDLRATVTGPDGTHYSVTSTQPIVDDPLGRFGTWWGVGFDEWNHGRSGIGTSKIGPTHSDVAIFALGELSANGKPIAAGVPIHAMTMNDPMGRLELDIGDPAIPLPGVPDGHLRAVWSNFSGGRGRAAEYAQYALGTAVLIAILALAITATRREENLTIRDLRAT
jgi:hypothetical protein